VHDGGSAGGGYHVVFFERKAEERWEENGKEWMYPGHLDYRKGGESGCQVGVCLLFPEGGGLATRRLERGP